MPARAARACVTRQHTLGIGPEDEVAGPPAPRAGARLAAPKVGLQPKHLQFVNKHIFVSIRLMVGSPTYVGQAGHARKAISYLYHEATQVTDKGATVRSGRKCFIIRI